MSRRELVNLLSDARENFCGLGTRKIKIRLNKCTDDTAKAYRLALEIEDCSTLGKKYRGDWSDRSYWKKSKLIEQLIVLAKLNSWPYGKHRSDGFGPRWVVYFELPGCEQISFHTNLERPETVDDYSGEWDGKRNSTLKKLETAIQRYFTEDQRAMFAVA